MVPPNHSWVGVEKYELHPLGQDFRSAICQHRWYLQPPPSERFFIPFPSGSRGNTWLITGPAARSSLVFYFQDHALRRADAQSRLWLLTTQNLGKTWAKNRPRIWSKSDVEGCKSRRINNNLD